MYIYIRIRRTNVVLELKRLFGHSNDLKLKKSEFFTFESCLYFIMSLFKNCLKPFSTFFPLPGYKTPYDHLKSGLNRHIFFSMGYKLEPYESWFVGMSDSFHLSDFSFVQFRKYLFPVLALWNNNAFNEPFFGLWEGWINNCNFNWNKKAKMELSKGMKDNSQSTDI